MVIDIPHTPSDGNSHSPVMNLNPNPNPNPNKPKPKWLDEQTAFKLYAILSKWFVIKCAGTLECGDQQTDGWMDGWMDEPVAQGSHSTW